MNFRKLLLILLILSPFLLFGFPFSIIVLFVVVGMYMTKGKQGVMAEIIRYSFVILIVYLILGSPVLLLMVFGEPPERYVFPILGIITPAILSMLSYVVVPKLIFVKSKKLLLISVSIPFFLSLIFLGFIEYKVRRSKIEWDNKKIFSDRVKEEGLSLLDFGEPRYLFSKNVVTSRNYNTGDTLFVVISVSPQIDYYFINWTIEAKLLNEQLEESCGGMKTSYFDKDRYEQYGVGYGYPKLSLDEDDMVLGFAPEDVDECLGLSSSSYENSQVMIKVKQGEGQSSEIGTNSTKVYTVSNILGI